MSATHLLLLFIVAPWTCLSSPVSQLGRMDETDILDKCSHDHVDRCVQSLVVYSVNDSLPLDAAEIDEACELESKNLQCLQDFLDNNCVHGFPKALLTASREGISDVRDAKCDKASELRRDYMKYIPCINTVGPRLRRCMSKAIQKLEAIPRHTTKKERIPYGCCYFEEFLQCVHDETLTACSPDHMNFIARVLDGAVGDVLLTACETYKGSSVCSELKTLPLEAPKATAFTSPLIKSLEPLG